MELQFAQVRNFSTKPLDVSLGLFSPDNKFLTTRISSDAEEVLNSFLSEVVKTLHPFPCIYISFFSCLKGWCGETRKCRSINDCFRTRSGSNFLQGEKYEWLSRRIWQQIFGWSAIPNQHTLRCRWYWRWVMYWSTPYQLEYHIEEVEQRVFKVTITTTHEFINTKSSETNHWSKY